MMKAVYNRQPFSFLLFFNKETEESPDVNSIIKLRTLQIYNIYIKTKDGKEIQLQIYVESFQDTKDL